MKNTYSFILVLLSSSVLAACGGDSSPSLQSRCEAYCSRRNADPECTNDLNCAAACAIIVAAATGCSAEVEAAVSCQEGVTDFCSSGGTETDACEDENAALGECISGEPDPDAGTSGSDAGTSGSDAGSTADAGPPSS